MCDKKRYFLVAWFDSFHPTITHRTEVCLYENERATPEAFQKEVARIGGDNISNPEGLTEWGTIKEHLVNVIAWSQIEKEECDV